MTTYLPFSPSFVPNRQPWTSPVTLDGNQYTLSSWWNIFSQEWYVTLTAPVQPTPVFTRSMVSSPPTAEIAGLVWEPGAPGAYGTLVCLNCTKSSQQGTAVVTAALPLNLGVGVGALVDLTVSGATPTGFNGTYTCVVVSATEFIYALTNNPGTPNNAFNSIPSVPGIPGYYSYDINLVSGYASVSTLVWRESSSWFEVNP